MLKPYLEKISEVASQGDAREESYYPILKELLEEYAKSVNKQDIHVTTLPKKTEAGNPDFRVWDGKQHIVGYVEAKSPTTEYLDQIETTNQLKRYLHTFPNLILTNFFEFRLYRNGDLVDKVLIGRPFVAHRLKTVPPVEKESEFLKLLEKFFSFSLPRVYDAKTLAVELAKRTRFLKDEVVAQELKEEEKAGKGFILGFYQAFKQYLISDLSGEDFADLYSQTVTYGLFAARTRSENGFNRRLAYNSIPHTIGILRDIFRFISLEDLPQQMEWIIDDISEVLAITDVKNILHQFFHEGKGRDPVVHFYETFLAEYDPVTREKRGVYYTPEAVVSYIVRSLHRVLKKDFNREDGFANSSVTVLDPAAGTLTFLAEASKLAVEEFCSKYGEGMRRAIIEEHVLKNFYAFELMMAPYAVGHLKMSFLLEELGYRLQKDDRFKLYLTNTLEMEELAQTELPGMASLSKESHLAGMVKKEQPILAILGNPPYSGHSFNPSGKWTTELKNGKEKRKKVKTWIGNLIEDYKFVDGKPLGEKNPKWLQDDYVKFIRFAQWKIDTAGEGILGFITNHSYLDNPTFRGMRKSLMNSFNEIYVLDLHGNSLKKEKCPDGSKDENVFDIQQGVAIALFVKKQENKREPLYPLSPPSPQGNLFVKKKPEEKPKKHKCRVFHSEVWGLREAKNDWLSKHYLKNTQWKRLSPKSEFHLFIPREEKLLKRYESYPKITDIFPVNSVGIVTARDNLTIRWTPDEVWSTVLNFSKIDKELARRAYNLGKDTRDWKVELAQRDLKDSGLDREKIVPILYRPFDIRHTYYTGHSRGFHCRPRPEVMRHMKQENLAMCVGRAGQVVGLEHGWNIVFCSEYIEDLNLFYRGGNVNFPLYLYKKEKENPKNSSFPTTMLIFESPAEYSVKGPNISQLLLEQLTKSYKKTPTPEQIFYYIYGILYSSTYRTKYAEFLKMDFPRIPFTKDYKLFSKMGEHGKKLVDLHLLKSTEPDSPTTRLQGEGKNEIEKVRYESTSGGRVYINENQYFERIEPKIWEYQIGGYQVCDKWLKDRKGRRLSLDDMKHYCKIITTLQKTIKIQRAIDDIYPGVEKDI